MERFLSYTKREESEGTFRPWRNSPRWQDWIHVLRRSQTSELWILDGGDHLLRDCPLFLAPVIGVLAHYDGETLPTGSRA